MARGCAGALAALLLWAPCAGAQVIATDEPPPPAQTPIRPPEPLPEPRPPETRESADVVLVAGAATASATALGVTLMLLDEGSSVQAGAVIGGLGLLAHVVSGPAIHGAHGRVWQAVASGVGRVGFGIGIPVLTAVACHGDCGKGAVLGAFGAGLLLPVAVEAALAWHPVDESSRADDASIVPILAPSSEGLRLGVAGRF